MGYYAVTLHFSEAQPASTTSAVGGLSRHGDHWTSGSGVDLIIDHVSEPLIIDRPDKDEVFKGSSRVRIHHEFVSVSLKASLVQLFGFRLGIEVGKRS